MEKKNHQQEQRKNHRLVGLCIYVCYFLTYICVAHKALSFYAALNFHAVLSFHAALSLYSALSLYAALSIYEAPSIYEALTFLKF